MAAQLDIFNDALAHLGERSLASLVEAREPQRVLTAQWPLVVQWALELQPWSFATRTGGYNPAAGVVPPAGYANTFNKPGDWVRTTDVALDGKLTQPLTDYVDEGPFWYADAPTIFVRYVSNDPQFGAAPQRWPQSFADLIAAQLAVKSAARIKGLDQKNSDETIAGLIAIREKAQQDAIDAEAAKAARVFHDTEQAGETRLQVYNDALAYLGRPRLYALTDARSDIRDLADQWRSEIRWCLQQAPWTFAARTQTLGVSADPIAKPGFANAVNKPADWITTLDIAADAALSQPLDLYTEDSRHWLCNTAGLTVRYVSADPTYGLDPTRWTPAFTDLLALRLALKCAPREGAKANDLDALAKRQDQAVQTAVAVEMETAARIFPVSVAEAPRVAIYNTVLERMGRPRIWSRTATRSDVRVLNDAWPETVLWCLQRAPWSFAAQVAMLATEAITPRAGFARSFTKPADHILTLNVSVDSDLTQPVARYVEEQARIFADAASLSIRYVSATVGADPTHWSPLFRDLIAFRLAEVVAARLIPQAENAAAGLAQRREEAEQAAIASERESIGRISPAAFTDPNEAVLLAVYNAALKHLGRPRIASRTQVGADMRALNDAYAEALRWCLEQGPWTFAVRAVMIGPYATTRPTFGYQNAFKKPDDWLQNVLVSGDEKFQAGLTSYADETGWWFADLAGLYVQYVSSGPNYGGCVARWAASFRDLLAVRLAELVAPQINPGMLASLMPLRQDAMKRQRATDALNTPPRFPPVGSWVVARRAGGRGRYRYGEDGGGGAPGQPLTGDTTLSSDSDLPVNSDLVPRISG